MIVHEPYVLPDPTKTNSSSMVKPYPSRNCKPPNIFLFSVAAAALTGCGAGTGELGRYSKDHRFLLNPILIRTGLCFTGRSWYTALFLYLWWRRRIATLVAGALGSRANWMFSFQLDAGTLYVDWAIENGWAVMDANIPLELTGHEVFQRARFPADVMSLI